MSSLLLTTQANVKAILPNTDATQDTLIDVLIEAVSRRAETYLGRDFESTERTELYDIGRRTRSIFLRNWPVDTGSTIEIKNDLDADFTATAAMSDTVYTVSARTGRVAFRGAILPGPDTMQVRYTGGMAADSSTLQSSYSDLEYAIRLQVAHEFRRKNSPGAQVATGSRRTQAGRESEGTIDWLKQVRDVLNSHRSHYIETAGLMW